MTYSRGGRRFRASKKRVERIRFTARDQWCVVLVALICLLAMLAGSWLGMNYQD
jgi:hypothetical protein